MGPNTLGTNVTESEPFSRETFAGGLLTKKSNPIWLSKEDKFLLFKAIEEYIPTQQNPDVALQRLGLSRQLYYGHIWFPPEAATVFEAALAAAHNPPEPEATEPQKKRMPNRTAAEKLRLIEEVSKIRYLGNMFLDEACRRVGIQVDSYHRWSSMRTSLIRAVQRGERHLRSGGNGSEKRGRPAKDIDPETLEHRRILVEEIHEEVLGGDMLHAILKERGITRAQYVTWAAQTDQEPLPPMSLIDLWKQTQEGDDRDAAKEKFMKHLTPMAKRIARRLALRKKNSFAYTIDIEDLVSHGLFEGVWMKIDEYNPAIGTPISAYFSSEISHRIFDALREQDWVPRLERQAIAERLALEEEFIHTMGRPASSPDELADYAGPERAAAVKHGLIFMGSLDTAGGHEWSGNIDDDDGWSLYEVLPSDEGAEDKVMLQTRDLVEQLIDRSFGIERQILEKYYLNGSTMSGIGQEVGLSESRVSQIHSAIIARLREIASNDAEMPVMKQ